MYSILFKHLERILCAMERFLNTLIVNTSQSFTHLLLITGFVSRLTQRVPLVEHQSSPLVFSRVRVTRSLALCISYVDRYLSFCTFSVGHCVVCHSSMYGFLLTLRYLQTLTTVSKYLILAFNGHLTKIM
jgi:hypothetical protein